MFGHGDGTLLVQEESAEKTAEPPSFGTRFILPARL
jgi:hypothetical protein